MESTLCTPQECKFVKAKFCKKCEDCPHYIESWWKSHEGQPKLVKDCFPKRSLLLQQEQINRSLSIQSANEEARNQIARLAEIFCTSMTKLIEISSAVLALPAKELSAGKIESIEKQE